ncbi:MAG: MBL fold metallo-hydrolase [Chloroflexota bacterium]
MEQVTANVYVETGFRGCNPGFVTTGEGIVLIDSPQNPSDVMKWREHLRGKGELRYLINTEPHVDHVAGNFFFPVPVISQKGFGEALTSLTPEGIREWVQAGDPEGLPLMEGYFLRKPSITFSERLFLYLGEHTFEVIHLPGHTASQSAVYVPEERVVFTGDNIFHKCQTFLHEAFPEQWLESLKRLDELDVDVIVPGHGGVCNKGYIAEQAAFIEEWIEAVREAIAEGLTMEEAQERISFLDRYPMDVGIDFLGLEVQRWNVARLYALLGSP